MKATTVAIVVGIATLSLSACTNPDGSTNNQATGTLVGAGAGGLIGNAIGGDTTSTLIGTGLGGVLGNQAGAARDRRAGY